LVNFMLFFHHFWIQKEFLSYQNIMTITDTSGKVRQVKTSQLGRMNQVTMSSVKQRLLSIWKKILEKFSKRRKSMTWSKNSEIFWYLINLYCEKTKEEDINDE
jgi:hypothetical protein